MKNRLVDGITVKQVLIDSTYHRLLKVKAAESGTTIKSLIEDCISEVLAVENNENDKQRKRNTE